ncbi:PRC-barrel domain-containing protein [Pseudolabrys taiwanensis]|nr:PRC-barrel domain-containing protein [Pseudolabrys taiwanensis]
MIKQTMTAAALVTMLAAPSFAQQPSTHAAPSATPGAAATHNGAAKPGFVQNQAPQDWRGSKLVGASVYGPDNQSIGEISDVIVDGTGKVKAAVIGVGGFLGVGQKDVAVPFDALSITRRQNSATIDKITVAYTKDDLNKAPKFAYYEPNGSSQTTGSSSTGTSTTNSGAGMKR